MHFYDCMNNPIAVMFDYTGAPCRVQYYTKYTMLGARAPNRGKSGLDSVGFS